jgi:hypothetical protein
MDLKGVGEGSRSAMAVTTEAIGGHPAGELHAVEPLLVQTSHCGVLNAANPEALSAVLTGGGETAMRSDCDEQLLIHLPFMGAVKLHSLQIQSAEGARRAACRPLLPFHQLTLACALSPLDSRAALPKTIKLFKNQTSMTFDDVDSIPPTQVIEISPSDVKHGSVTIPLAFVKFQCVQTLTIFIEDNLDDAEVTQLSKLQVFGMPLQTTNMSDLKQKG